MFDVFFYIDMNDLYDRKEREREREREREYKVD